MTRAPLVREMSSRWGLGRFICKELQELNNKQKLGTLSHGACVIHDSEEPVREAGLERLMGFGSRNPHSNHYNELIIITMTKTVNNDYSETPCCRCCCSHFTNEDAEPREMQWCPETSQLASGAPALILCPHPNQWLFPDPGQSLRVS